MILLYEAWLTHQYNNPCLKMKQKQARWGGRHSVYLLPETEQKHLQQKQARWGGRHLVYLPPEAKEKKGAGPKLIKRVRLSWFPSNSTSSIERQREMSTWLSTYNSDTVHIQWTVICIQWTVIRIQSYNSDIVNYSIEQWYVYNKQWSVILEKA